RAKPGGAAGSQPPRLAAEPIRRPRARAPGGARRPGPGNPPPRNRGAAALSASRDHSAPDAVRSRRGNHGHAGRLPHLQYSPRRRPQGRRGPADRIGGGMSGASESYSRNRLLALLAAFALAWFCNLGYRHLVKPDEGRYAEIPREMVASGDWLTPRLNGFKYFEKPPLQYWATAVSFSVLGQHEWAARLWPAVPGFRGCLRV